MSIPRKPLCASPNRHLTHVSLILLACGLLLAASVSAQTGAGTGTATIRGTAVDVDNNPIAGATVVLQGAAAGDHRTVVTTEDGSFAFSDVTSRATYQVTVTAEGFGAWSSSVAVEPGQVKTLTDVRLRIEAARRSVTVNYSAKQTAIQQLKVEEKQRVLGFIPNIYVTYETHPEPLTSGMKFHLAYKSLTNPVNWGWIAMWSGIQQAADTPDYSQGTKGYGKRFGANAAGAVTEGLIGNAILPSLLHQDPRYYYRGNGTTKSRLFHAISAPFVTPADNGHLQPNYSTWGGSLISNAIAATTYLPSSDRTAGHVFGNFGIGMAVRVFGSFAQEFILDKFTSKGNKH